MVKGCASGIDLSLSDEEIGEFYDNMVAQVKLEGQVVARS